MTSIQLMSRGDSHSAPHGADPADGGSKSRADSHSGPHGTDPAERGSKSRGDSHSGLNTVDAVIFNHLTG